MILVSGPFSRAVVNRTKLSAQEARNLKPIIVFPDPLKSSILDLERSTSPFPSILYPKPFTSNHVCIYKHKLYTIHHEP
jgi:hypothetical protein